MSETKTTNFGIGFTGMLTIVFVVLKLTKVIDWSWWWVTAPVWIPLSFAAVIFMIVGIITLAKNR